MHLFKLQEEKKENVKKEKNEEEKDEEATKKRKEEEAVRKAQEKQDRRDGKFDPEEEIYYSDVLHNRYFIGTSRKTGKKYTMLPSGKTKYVNMDVAPRVEHEVTTPDANTVIPDNYQSFQYTDEELDKKFAPPPPPAPTAKQTKLDLMRQRHRARKDERGKK